MRRSALTFIRAMCSDLDAELGLRRSLTKKLAQQRPRSERQEPVAGPVARVSTAPLRPDAADDLVKAYASGGRKLYDACPGFLGSVLLLSQGRNRARSITMWQSTSDMDAAVLQPE